MPDTAYFILTAALSIAAFFLGHLAARKSEKKRLWALVAMILLVLKAVLHWKPSWEAALFPWVGYIYFQSYWLYPIGLFFFGLAVPQLPVRWNRAMISGAAACLFLVSLWNERWMLFPPDDSSTRTAGDDHHCRQTTGYTCAPAACVTLLSYWGIDATEGEMTRLCRTREGGTTLFHTYRGLVLKTRGRPLEVRIVETDLDGLISYGVPVIIGDWHAMVIDLRGDEVVMHDPLTARPRRLALDEFRESCYYIGEAVLIRGDTRLLQDAPSCESGVLRVMTFNIWKDGEAGREPLDRTVEVIRRSKADVVGMQEVDRNAKAIADMLGWYHARLNEGTAVFSRFEIVGLTEKKHGVRLRLDSGQEIYVFNVHLAAAPYQPYQLLHIPYREAPFLRTEDEAIAAARKARGDQVAALLEEIGTIEDGDAVVVVTGDFNEPSHLDWTDKAAREGRHPLKVAYPASRAMASAGFTDAYRVPHPDETAHPGFTWTPTSAPDDPGDHHDRIDFVYVRGARVKVRAAEIVGESDANADIVVTPYPSDHRAVVVTLVVAPD